VIACKHYSAYAIAGGFWLYGVQGGSLQQTRSQAAPGSTFEQGWPSLRRWAHAVAEGELFPSVRPWPSSWSLRQKAERIATTLLALVASDERGPQVRLRRGAELAA